MAKNNMGIKYKRPKRERNKVNYNMNETDGFKKFFIVLASVLVFIVLVYLGVLGLEKLGAVEAGYTKPSKEATKISTEYIMVGTVFNRPEKDYIVIFDDYSKNRNPYVNTLAKNYKLRAYKVDMSKAENSKYKSDKANTNVKKDSDLKINDVTMIRITNGRVSKYIVGADKIEEYLKSTLKLELNRNKTKIVKSNEWLEFLGYNFKVDNKKTIIKLRSKSLKRIKNNIKKTKYLYESGKISFEKSFCIINNYKYSYKYVNNKKIDKIINKYWRLR